MPVYEIMSFRGALSDYEDKGIAGAFKFGSNLDIRKQVDSLSCGQALVEEGLDTGHSPSASQSPSSSISLSPSSSQSRSPSATASPSASASPSSSGSRSPSTTPSSSISPSPSPSSGLTTVFHDLIRFFVKASNGYTYGIGSTGYIYQRDSDAYWNIEYKDPDGAIKGAVEKPSSNGKTYLIWATDRAVKSKEIPGLANWNDVTIVATNLDSHDWHTMVQVGGSAMIANGSRIAMVGWDDSYTNEALQLIPGNVSKTMIERNGRLIVGCARASDLDNSINGAIDSEVPLAQVGENGEIHFADMNETMPIKKFPGGGKVNPGGVCNEIDQVNFFEWDADAVSWIDKQSVGNLALFAVYNADAGKGGIYSYGRKNKNHPMVLNLDHLLDADELGAITNVDGTTLVSYRDGSSFGVKAVDPNNKVEAVYEGLDFKAPMKKPVNITNWTYTELFCSPLPEGTSIEFWYKINKYGSFIQAKTDDDSTTFTATGEKKAVFLIGAEGDIYEPRVVLKPYGNVSPEVYRIRNYFE